MLTVHVILAEDVSIVGPIWSCQPRRIAFGIFKSGKYINKAPMAVLQGKYVDAEC